MGYYIKTSVVINHQFGELMKDLVLFSLLAFVSNTYALTDLSGGLKSMVHTTTVTRLLRKRGYLN